MEDRGTYDNPYLVAPDDWHENGLPYGAYCRCWKCGFIARSTFGFDYYANGVGDKLECESCTMGSDRQVVAKVVEQNWDYINNGDSLKDTK